MSQKMAGRPVDGDGNREKQTPRTIRFYDRDWARIETHAAMQGMTAAEFVRAATIAAVGDRPAPADSGGYFMAQVDQIFRYVHILATAKRSEMLTDGRGEELEALIRSAQALQGELRKRWQD